ncbi:T9SS type A sorting domain-containing protein [Flavobacterium sp.]|uniref:T9SS type A sorting domain-containing protein n=1 Tax=Flavobacterium sp. TaxID=239 RepID=UPI002B4B1D91|nr:T9SS type A sorting domain-containing protein [Flavobacterium sp.]HLP63264.1 T9SS type A sorting domain-containing protein [Flavobacterium sp.]
MRINTLSNYINTLIIIFILHSNFSLSQTVALDTNFGTLGKVELNLGNTFVLKDVKIAPNNYIYVLGQITENNTVKTLLIKYTPTGTLDTAFGVNGILETTFSPLTNFIPSVLNLINDKVLVAGTFLNAPNTTFSREPMIIRLNDLGSIDNTFGDNGYLMINVNPNPTFYRYLYGENIFSFNKFQNNDMLLQIQCHGVVVGESTQSKAVLIKMNSDGGIITPFGENGVMEIQTPLSTYLYDDEVLSNDNFTFLGVTSGYGLFLLYNNSGNYMQSHNFQTQGLYSFLDSDSNVSNIYATGSTISTKYIVKFNQTLNHDANFGTNGILNVPYAGKIKVSQNRFFNVIGTVNNNHMFKITDYTLNGFLNTNFGENGVFDINFGTNTHTLKSLFNVDDDKLLLVGTHGENLVLTRIVFEALSNEEFDESIITKVYPNPIQDQLNIDSESIIESVSIVTITGQKLEEYHFENKSIQLNLEHLSAGIYFVKVNSGDKTQTVKIIKN